MAKRRRRQGRRRAGPVVRGCRGVFAEPGPSSELRYIPAPRQPRRVSWLKTHLKSISRKCWRRREREGACDIEGIHRERGGPPWGVGVYGIPAPAKMREGGGWGCRGLSDRWQTCRTHCLSGEQGLSHGTVAVAGQQLDPISRYKDDVHLAGY